MSVSPRIILDDCWNDSLNFASNTPLKPPQPQPSFLVTCQQATSFSYLIWKIVWPNATWGVVCVCMLCSYILLMDKLWWWKSKMIHKGFCKHLKLFYRSFVHQQYFAIPNTQHVIFARMVIVTRYHYMFGEKLVKSIAVLLFSGATTPQSLLIIRTQAAKNQLDTWHVHVPLRHGKDFIDLIVSRWPCKLLKVYSCTGSLMYSTYIMTE